MTCTVSNGNFPFDVPPNDNDDTKLEIKNDGKLFYNDDEGNLSYTFSDQMKAW